VLFTSFSNPGCENWLIERADLLNAALNAATGGL